MSEQIQGGVVSSAPNNRLVGAFSPTQAVFVSEEVKEREEAAKERKKEKDLEIRIRAMASATDADFKTPDEYMELTQKFYKFMKGATHE